LQEALKKKAPRPETIDMGKKPKGGNMSRIVEYAVITGKDSDDLTTKVNEKLNEGWRLRGNIVCTAINCSSRSYTAKSPASASERQARTDGKNPDALNDLAFSKREDLQMRDFLAPAERGARHLFACYGWHPSIKCFSLWG